MPFHVAAWNESQDVAALTAHAALVDQALTTSGDDIAVPSWGDLLIAAYGLGANITRARIESPSLRGVFNYEIYPLDVAAEPTSRPAIHLFPESPIQLLRDERMQAFASEDAAGAARQVIAIWLASGVIVPVTGEIFSTRVTGAATLVANVWSFVSPLTFAEALPAGRYDVVGARFESAGAQLGRLVFSNQPQRPGAPAFDAASDIEPALFRRGGLGVWGTFDHNDPPRAEFLSVSADTSEILTLDLIKRS